MFDPRDNSQDDDSALKDAILEKLLDALTDNMGEDPRLQPKGMQVEVAAPDKAHLAEGLDKAKEVVQHAPVADALAGKGDSDRADDEDDGQKSDAERLAELLGADADDEDEEGRRC